MLRELITEDLIVPQLANRGKEEVIGELCSLFGQAGVVGEADKFEEAIKVREGIESTAVGEGVAIPHGRSEAVSKLAVAFGGSKEGVEFNSLDGKPVHLIFMIAAPLDAKREYLQTVARIARLLKIKSLKEELLKSRSVEDVMKVLEEFDSRYPSEVEVRTKEGRVIHRS